MAQRLSKNAINSTNMIKNIIELFIDLVQMFVKSQQKDKMYQLMINSNLAGSLEGAISHLQPLG